MMITLTKEVDGKPLYVNPKKIAAVFEKWNGRNTITVVWFGWREENYITVLESPESIMQMMKDRKMNKKHLREILDAYNDGVCCNDCPVQDACQKNKNMGKSCQEIVREYIFGKENE